MQLNKWIISSEYRTWNITTKINNTYYRVKVYVDWSDSEKTIRYWFGLSSGTKRKHLDIFEDKKEKSDGGIPSLLWSIKMFHDFPPIYRQQSIMNGVKNEYICIKWSDNRRRNIYSRLQRYGFKFMIDQNEKVLLKSVKV